MILATRAEESCGSVGVGCRAARHNVYDLPVMHDIGEVSRTNGEKVSDDAG